MKNKKNPIPMHSLPSPTILDNGRRKHLNGKNCTDGHSKSTLIKWNKKVTRDIVNGRNVDRSTPLDFAHVNSREAKNQIIK